MNVSLIPLSGAPGMRRLVLPAILLLAAALRLWPLLFGALPWHPDEYSYVITPLNFFSGHLNPHFFAYPTGYYYLLAIAYAASFLVQHVAGAGLSLYEWVIYHYYWSPVPLLTLARWINVGFSIGTIAAVAALARQLRGPSAGWIAALLLTVSNLHLRQSPLAAVDTPMTCLCIAAIWAGVRLGECARWSDYALAGALVGLAAGFKYPGALAGAAVVAAHLLAGRRPWDRHLWLSGFASIVVFAAVSPYVVLDYRAFLDYFRLLVDHAQEGRADLGNAWWYQLRVSLRYSLGWLGLLGLAMAAADGVLRRRREQWVVLAAFAAFWLVTGSGHLIFARYVLPLAALQAVLVAVWVSAVRQLRWRVMLVGLLLLEPTYGALRIAQLQTARDTREEARNWIEAHVPAGSTCCNFGGWAGDVPLATFEDLGWRIQTFASAFGWLLTEEELTFLADRKPPSPFYSYAVQYGNRYSETGSLEEMERQQCAYAILHRHPLSYSHIDTAFSRELAQRGSLVARFSPAGLWESAPRYDPNDAYYLPIGDFGGLRQPGPDVEIWHLEQTPPVDDAPQTGATVLARGHALAAYYLLRDPERAVPLLEQALQLDPHSAEAYFILGALYQKAEQYGQAAGFFQRAIELRGDYARAYTDLGLVYSELGQYEKAIQCWQHSRSLQPDLTEHYNNLGRAFFYSGRHREAIANWTRLVDLEESSAEICFNIGLAHARLDEPESAAKWWRKVADEFPDHPLAAEVDSLLNR